ncbi:heavy-metal-associated domain-containing protein [Desertibacillus haloalkaliphilus]|uniref:heavy-metal-associated domain-containing protein n=1 Tax=Desertibacillus haloalkaliphilus TaxID=1328930 RepID=UPI001C25E4B0|nr:cation transporter [Desertibacillus haloalkaliphilus]MBU8907351.1 cation transporter [Desertibacillus haloalkaliphilus]
MKHIDLQVERMSCGHCLDTVEHALENVEGVVDAKVHPNNNTVTVTFEESQTNVTYMREAVEEAGYWIV